MKLDLSKYQDNKSWGWYRLVPKPWRDHVSSSLPKKVLEIGAFDGGSANVMLDAIFPHPDSEVHTVDPFLPDPTTPQVTEGTKALFHENCRRGGHGGRVKLYEGFSRDVLAWVIAGSDDFLESYDVIFIDGSHMAKDVLLDATMAWPLLKPGGILIFDDYEWGKKAEPHARPREAIDAFLAAYAQEVMPVWTGYQKMVRKVSDGRDMFDPKSGLPAKRICAVIGLYNSGTSAVAQILETLGFAVGRPGTRNFGESDQLKNLLTTWWKEPKLERSVSSDQMIKGLGAWLDAVNAVNNCVCAKHPLLCLTLPELEQAWGQDTYLIRLVRPLQDSIDGLKRRNWFGEPERMQRVLYQATEDFFSNGRPHLSVDFGNLLADPMHEIRKIGEFLNIAVPEDRLNWAAKRIIRS